MPDTPLRPDAAELLQARLRVRANYSAALITFLARLDSEGLSDAVRSGRSACVAQVMALARLGLVSSSAIHAGEDVWRLRFTKVGRSIRKLLQAEAAHA